MYILAASSISHQPTFRNKGYSMALEPLQPSSGIIHPDYKAFIPASYRRRMSDVIKMASTCAMDCLSQCGPERPDAIIVGTGMGCPQFTQDFLDNIISAGGGLLSPTAFIFSTHNTIAGQISLLLSNHAYNTTHTQNSLSFEHALLDGLVCGKEGKTRVLLGGADEMGGTLYDLEARLGEGPVHLTCGASFFMLSTQPPDRPAVRILDVAVNGSTGDLIGRLTRFLQANSCRADDLDLVLLASLDAGNLLSVKKLFPNTTILDYQAFSGHYYTNPAFAMAYGYDRLMYTTEDGGGEDMSRVLILNNLLHENLGLILMEKHTADAVDG